MGPNNFSDALIDLPGFVPQAASLWGIRGGSINAVKRLTVSTGGLNTFLYLQFRPINLVVYQGSLTIKVWNPHLDGGFTLRCFQRLSFPNLAILPCL